LTIDVSYVRNLVKTIKDFGAEGRPLIYNSINLDDLNPLERALAELDSASNAVVGTEYEIGLLTMVNCAESEAMQAITLPEAKKRKATREIKLEEIYAKISEKYPAVFNGNGSNSHKNASNGKS
jgi:hypothetical protein